MEPRSLITAGFRFGGRHTGRVRGSPRRRKKLVVLAARHPLPTIFADREQAEAGGLIRDTTPQRKPPWVSLATTPVPSGSPIAAITTGVVAVAAWPRSQPACPW